MTENRIGAGSSNNVEKKKKEPMQVNGEIEPVEMELEVIAPSALESIERANVDIQISTARKYPRKLGIVKQRMLNLATLDEETAASCFYR